MSASPDNQITFATYNHMFGCEGNSFLSWVGTHLDLHFRGDLQAVRNRSDIKPTIQTIKQVPVLPDVLGICEVLGKGQREQITEALKAIGYAQIHHSSGHRMKGQEEFVESILATKLPSQSAPSIAFSVPDRMGHGGGIVKVHIPDIELDVLQVHLPKPSWWQRVPEAVFKEQMDAVLGVIESTRGRLIVMGDFNHSYADLIRKTPQLVKLAKLSVDLPTCPTTRGMGMFEADLDHILGKGFDENDVIESGLIKGASDHKLSWSKVRLERN